MPGYSNTSSISPENENPCRKLVYPSSDLSNAQLMSSPDPLSGDPKGLENNDLSVFKSKPRAKRIVSAAPSNSPFAKNYSCGNDNSIFHRLL